MPVAGYVGHFRGDPSVPELIAYEVGLGGRMPDGYPEKMGVWAAQVRRESDRVLAGLHGVLEELDRRCPIGSPPRTPDQILGVVGFAALAHGEWLRVHPFVNGNGRTARLLVAYVCLRYGLPVFLRVKPRPEGHPYARASHDSMGRPPDFAGEHGTATALFVHLLAEELTGGAG